MKTTNWTFWTSEIHMFLSPICKSGDV